MHAILVAAVAVAVYANSLGGALLYDDGKAIVENTWVHVGDPFAILTQPSWWPEGTSPGWRPLTTLTFAVNYALHGLDPFGYHLVNVLLHAAVSVLLLVTFAYATGAPVAATVAGLLFALHPVHTEAVASVVGRAELLATGGLFAAWLSFLYADGRAGRHPRRAAYALVEGAGVVAFLAALLAKESALALLPVLVLADLLYPLAGTTPAATLRRHAGRYVALVAAVALFVACRRLVGADARPEIDALDNLLVSLPAGARLMTAIKVLGLYGRCLVFPLWLSADYSYGQIEPVTSPLDVGFAFGLTLLVGVPAAAWVLRRRAPAAALALGYLVLTFGLISNLVVLIGTLMAERLLYLPSAGFCLLIGTLLAGRTPGERRPLLATRVLVPLGLLAALYGARTWTRNAVWHDPQVFFATMVRDAPRSARSHAAFGSALADAGRHAEARRELEQALSIYANDPGTLYNLGNALLALGSPDAAVGAYQQALALDPGFAKAMVNLGTAESRRGNRRLALEWMRRAETLNPRSPILRLNLANALAAEGATAEARAAYEAALALSPESPAVLRDYGTFLDGQGESAAGVAFLERAVAHDAHDATAHYNLGTALARLGRLDEAARALERALAERPDFVAALTNLGNVESLRGDHAGALAWLRRAVALEPDSAVLHGNIANELFRLGALSDARAEYERALALAPASPAIRQNYEVFLSASRAGS